MSVIKKTKQKIFLLENQLPSAAFPFLCTPTN